MLITAAGNAVEDPRTTLKLCRYDAIARYVADKEGRPCSPRTARKYACDPDDPLPARKSGRVVVAESADVDAWLLRRHRPPGGRGGA